METWYQPDLAYIHDVGFADYALNAAPGLLQHLRQHHIDRGLVVDLGCGSGLWAEQLVQEGYHVLGIDISAAMIELAQRRVPSATFRVASLFQAELPVCVAVTAVGECLNYLFDPKFDPNDSLRALQPLFQRIHAAIPVGGLFLFDIVEAGQVPPDTPVRSYTEGDDWVVLVEKQENLAQQLLTRRIITFCQAGEHYRRHEEVHQQRLLQAARVADVLTSLGFEVQMMNRYGTFDLPVARVAFVACKTS